MDATIRLGGLQKVLGVDVAGGFFPQGISATANESGSDTLTFAVRRDAAIPDAELAPFTPVELEVGGIVCWSGYVWETPASAERITVNCRGWQYHLDDDHDQRIFVLNRMDDWIDVRTGWSAATADLTVFVAAYLGAPPMQWPVGINLPANKVSALILDGGYAGAIKRVVVKLTNNAWTGPAAATLYMDGSDTLPVGFGGANQLVPNLLLANASQYKSGTLATARRYVMIWFGHAGGTPVGADNYIRFEGIQSFASTAYESGNASILKASDVVKAVLFLAPSLDQSTALVQTTSFSIPELGEIGKFATARQYMNAANAFHDWLLQVNVDKRLVYRPRPSSPVVEVGAWGGSVFQDAAIASGEEVYNWVGVQGTGPDGAPVNVFRNLASPLLNLNQRTRTFTLNVGAVITTAAADAIGDAWLATHARSPLRGSLTVAASGGARSASNGQPVEPYEFLMLGGEMIRFTDRPDPDTGLWGRSSYIQSVSYDHDSGTASLAIDSPRDHLDALLARLGVVESGAGLSS